MSKEKKSEKKVTIGKAKKDFHIFCPPHADIRIEKGDDLAEIPEMFHDNLRTEGVI